jgi:hypothetical protein
VTYLGRPLSRWSLPPSGVRYSLNFELVLAARWRGLSDEHFEALPLEGQARTLAAYRTAMQLEAVQTHHPMGQKKRR